MLKKAAVAFGILSLFLITLALAWPPLKGDLPISNPRVAAGNLRAIVRAQESYRSSSHAGRIGEYWRDDVAQLYTGDRAGSPRGLIELDVALADDRPKFDLSTLGKRAPLRGYWFRSVRFRGETVPDLAHFALCAFPDSYPAQGRPTLLANDSGAVFAKDLGCGGGVEWAPQDPLQAGWRKVE